MAVYAAGYQRTRPAAERLNAQSIERRPAPAPVAAPAAPLAPDAPSRDPVAPRLPSQPESAAAAESKPAPTPPPAASGESTIPAAASPAETAPAPPPAAIAPEPVAVAAPVPAPAAVAPAPPAPSPVPAPAPTPAPAPAVSSPAGSPPWKDGTYLGWGHCRHGNIQASVVIEAGRIASATIAQCLTRYDCNVIDNLPPQVPKRQNPDVDTISGATQSSDAFYYAVVDALSKAK